MSDQPATLEELEEAQRLTWAALLALDPRCRIVQANPAALRLSGKSLAQVRCQRFCEVFQATPCTGLGAENCLFSRALQGRERRARPRWLTSETDGHTYSALVSAASTRVAPRGRRESGAVVTMVPGQLIDDADRRRRELIATALHDLRHVASIQTMAVDLLGELNSANALPAHVQPLLDTLRHGSASLSTSLDDLLNRTLFELDAIPLQPRTIELFPLLQGVVARLAPILQTRQQRADLIIPHDLHAWIDPTALEHVIVNLLLNAHKYSVEGDTIVLAAREVPHTDLVELSVRDHGPGISAEERRRVFERYYRAARARSKPGAGLGLAIVRSIAEQQGGSAGLRAPRGGGALVWVRLPAAAPQSSEATYQHREVTR